ncbi:hypothetical protein E3N88_25559 [Mikania micrantha]|uniref:Uncharacterized protein n=1 Tax=Mikania micrantha TaxID=192012 RepID=A0A5N6M4F4_9ASTR|nr:hypothetical protein E3N88_36498 [Mikania micrantha]KAD4385391.1 hypothetical protein E3N88_25559 [Mikania micrantha]
MHMVARVSQVNLRNLFEQTLTKDMASDEQQCKASKLNDLIEELLKPSMKTMLQGGYAVYQLFNIVANCKGPHKTSTAGPRLPSRPLEPLTLTGPHSQPDEFCFHGYVSDPILGLIDVQPKEIKKPAKAYLK